MATTEEIKQVSVLVEDKKENLDILLQYLANVYTVFICL
jgi:hypothetical protein